MQFDITAPPFSVLRTQLQATEKLWGIPGAMVSHTGNIQIQNRIVKSRSIRKWLATLFGKSIFQQEIIAQNTAEIIFKPQGTHIIPIAFSGDKTLIVSPDNYFLFTGLDYEVVWLHYNPFVKFWGEGTLFLSSYGELIEMQIIDNQCFRINDDYLVAFEPEVKFIDDWNWKGLKNSLVSGTDYIRLEGKGKFWLQSRESLASASGGGSIWSSLWRFFD
ncbi:MAG: AIM24 family protein [Microscillaceae bacterium]|jgi:uncharacterized protein (AIM24 family)|nr:AIM24 family protein [Microscillaceae bacterium]